MPFGFHSKSLITTALSAHLGDVTDVTGIFLGDGAVISAALANVDFVPVSGITVATFANAGYLGSTVTSGNTFSLRGYTGAAYSALLTITNAATPTIAIPQLAGDTIIGTTTAGANLTINGTETETITQPMVTGGWTLNTDTGGWAITAGSLAKTASTGTLTAVAVTGQSTITSGRFYRVTVVVSAISGIFTATLGGGQAFQAAGTGTYVGTRVASSNAKLTFSGAATSTITITSVSVIEVTAGTGAITSGGPIFSKQYFIALKGNPTDSGYMFDSGNGLGTSLAGSTGMSYSTGNVLAIQNGTSSIVSVTSVGTNVVQGFLAAGLGSVTTASGKVQFNDTTLAASGSLTGSMLLMTQTWNTTGTPTGIKYTITDTASNAASLAMQILGGTLGTTNLLSVSKAGALIAPTLTAGAIATQDVLTLSGITSATRFTGTIQPIDFTEDHTIQVPDSSGIMWVTGDNFHRPHLVVETDWTAKSLANAATNYVLGSPIGVITYREEGAKTTSSWNDVSGELSIVGDGAATNDEGVEIIMGDTTGTSGWITTGAAGAHGGGTFEVHASIALIAGTDQFIIGWRNVAAFDAANIYTNYADYSAVGITNVDGSIFSLSGKAGTDATDDSGVNAANADSIAFRVSIAATTGLPTASYSINGAAFVDITMTNTGAARTAAVQMVPFISYMHVGTSINPGITISNMYIYR